MIHKIEITIDVIVHATEDLSLINISNPTRQEETPNAVFGWKKKKKN